jgi:hypothetical protein
MPRAGTARAQKKASETSAAVWDQIRMMVLLHVTGGSLLDIVTKLREIDFKKNGKAVVSGQ